MRCHNEKWWRVTSSRLDTECTAPRTLVPGGATPGWGVARWRLRASREPPTYVPRWAYEGVHNAVWSAQEGAATAERRMVAQAEVDYDLVYAVMRLAPSFGRTRGKLRGAAGHMVEWPACRTRASLAAAEEAEETARCAWRASEQSMRELWAECERIRRCTEAAEWELAEVRRLRREDAASCWGRTGSTDERVREEVLELVVKQTAAL